MIYDVRNISDDLVKQIINSFEKTKDLYEVDKLFKNVDFNILLSALYSQEKYRNLIEERFLAQKNINENKIIIISDSHYGAIFSNMKYADIVYDYAIKNNIKTILHCGDLLEGTIIPKTSELNNYKQAKYFIEKFPFDKNINMSVILGNHDYNIISNNYEIKNILNSREDIDILGFRKTYLNWCNEIISIYHSIEKIKLNFPIMQEVLKFKGHSHFYHTRNQIRNDPDTVFVPAFCDENMYNSGVKTIPGFIVASISDNIYVENYSFNENDFFKENEYIKILTKN